MERTNAMCCFRSVRVVAVWGLVSLLSLPRAARAASSGQPEVPTDRAEESEPSIEEMWAKTEIHLASQRAAKKDAGPGAAAEKRAGPAKGSKRTLDFGPLLKRLHGRARERLEFAKRHEDQFRTVQIYLRLEAFDNAAKNLMRMLNSGQTGRWRGRIETGYAVAMAHLGRQRIAEQYVSLSEKLLQEDGRGRGGADVRGLRRIHEFVRNYPLARKKLAELTASLAEAPDGNSQWKIVKLYNPIEGDVGLAVKWVVAIHTMRVLYPDHPVNQNGKSDVELSLAYEHHEMYEECITHVTQLLSRKPWTTHYTKSGKAHWDRALSQEQLANLLLQTRDRQRTLANFQRALEYFRQFQKELPDCSYTRRGEGGEGRSHVDVRIHRIRDVIDSLGGRR